MKPERWKEIEAIFDAACDAPDAERGALLDRACEGDAELRAEVESLLERSLGAMERLQGIVGREASRAAERASAPVNERQLGPYRLVREIGQGGMGAVYLAVRDDDEYRTEVAIKLLHQGLETANAVARFRDERQILASLEHPGIVRLLDGGSTAEGLPYLVMERVEGAPITRWADARDLDVPARVALFREVCAAVAYAHRKLVVHRDLKPSNIVVTPGGAPKLLDFGIAKLLDPTADVGREARTRTGMRLLTPEYASPEQVRGEPASTSSDVYSLGAVFYELLTGAPAHRLEGEGLEALRAMLEVDPPRPSAVAPTARRRAIAGDLDNIVQKAMHKDPDRRYASVEQLSDDLGRHLEGLPVLARPATLGYRTGKLLRRNRGLAAALAVVLASLSAATVISVRQARRADVQARRADEQARRAQKRFDDVRRLASSMLFEVDGKLQSLEGATDARAVLVSRALEYLDGLSVEAGDDAALSRELAAGYVKIGDIQGSSLSPNLGRPRDALASYAKARQIVERLVASGHGDGATLWTLARALHGASVVHAIERETAPARASALGARRIIETLPRDAAFDHYLAALVYLQLNDIATNEGDPTAAERYAKECLDMAVRWADETRSPDARYWIGLARAMFGIARSSAGDPDTPIRELDEARALFTALAAEHPQNAVYRREIWTSLYIGASWRSGISNGFLWPPSAGAAAAAEDMLREALVLAERRSEKDAKDSRAAAELMSTLDQLAATVAERDPAASLPLFQRARGIVAALPEPAREAAFTRQYEWFGQCAMAASLAKLGRREAALAALDRGLPIAAREAEGDRLDARLSPWLCRHYAARAHQALGDTEISTRLLEESAAGLRQTIASFPAVIPPYVGLVATLELLATLRPERRCDLLDQAAAAWRSWPGTPTPYTRHRQASLDASLAACRTGR